MNTVKIYKTTCTKAYNINEQGVGFSLYPWGENTEIIEGFDDGGKDYILPDRYEVAESKSDTLEIYDAQGKRAQITSDPGDNAPTLVTEKEIICLTLA